jgi:chemotaxis protein methyltransferase WspC
MRHAGHLDEAIGLCLEVLDKEPTNADALCLMGLVWKVRGRIVEAESFFQKALYIEPRHEETLVHMMLLAQERGDEKAAANFRRRADRAQGREARR